MTLNVFFPKMRLYLIRIRGVFMAYEIGYFAYNLI